MGSLWGLNNSMARVHALLIASEGAISLDHIAKTLNISRGNASMCLKELRNWGVVHRVRVAGDRRDYYEAPPDIWSMFFAIARERKRREMDPLLKSLKEMLRSRETEGGEVTERLKEMEKLLSTMDAIAEKLLADEETAKRVFESLAGAS